MYIIKCFFSVLEIKLLSSRYILDEEDPTSLFLNKYVDEYITSQRNQKFVSVRQVNKKTMKCMKQLEEFNKIWILYHTILFNITSSLVTSCCTVKQSVQNI